jgi:hypothetical protein
MLGPVQFIGDPEDITNIDADTATVIMVPGKIVDCGLECSVKIDPDKFTFRIEDRTS